MNSLDKIDALNALLACREVDLFLKEFSSVQIDYPISVEMMGAIHKLIENIEKNKQHIANQLISVRKSLIYINRV
jgi:hypothetical protein